MLTRSRGFGCTTKTHVFSKQNHNSFNNPSNVLSPFGPLGGSCSGGNLKDVRGRIKTIRSIEKITRTMKMIASSRLKAAQTRMEKARPFYEGASKVMKIIAADTGKRNLLIPVTADRGLCGSINSSIVKATRHMIEQRNLKEDLTIVPVGSKGSGILGREFGNRIPFSFDDMGKKPYFPSFSLLTEKIIKQVHNFDSITVLYNKFNSIISFTPESKDIPSPNQILSKIELSDYEFEDDQRIFQVQDLFEFELGALLYYSFVEGSASELGARMSAMDSASRNAKDMLKALNIAYNRKRQAAITTELTEIISGAAAIVDQ